MTHEPEQTERCWWCDWLCTPDEMGQDHYCKDCSAELDKMEEDEFRRQTIKRHGRGEKVI